MTRMTYSGGSCFEGDGALFFTVALRSSVHQLRKSNGLLALHGITQPHGLTWSSGPPSCMVLPALIDFLPTLEFFISSGLMARQTSPFA